MLGNESQARVNGGTWSKMSFNNVIITPGATGSASWTTNMRCGGNAKRDLRLKYQDSGDSNTYPRMVDNVDIDDGLTYGPYSIKNDQARPSDGAGAADTCQPLLLPDLKEKTS